MWSDQSKLKSIIVYYNSYPGNSQRLIKILPSNESESPGSGTLHDYPQRHRCRRLDGFVKVLRFAMCHNAPAYVLVWMTSAEVWGKLQLSCRKGRTLRFHSGRVDTEVPPLIRARTKIAYLHDESLWPVWEDIFPENYIQLIPQGTVYMFKKTYIVESDLEALKGQFRKVKRFCRNHIRTFIRTYVLRWSI